MDAYALIVILGLSYAVIFQGLGLLKREGFSMQFMLEATAITLLTAGAGYLTRSDVNPILFLVFVYLVTMRARLLTDVANILSNRGRQRHALALLQVALSLYPDKPSRLIVLVNMGIVQILRKNPKSAEGLFNMVMDEAKSGGLGLRYEAACLYNLGIALRAQGKDAQAVRYFRDAAETYPASLYGKAAMKALEERRTGKKKEKE